MSMKSSRGKRPGAKSGPRETSAPPAKPRTTGAPAGANAAATMPTPARRIDPAPAPSRDAAWENLHPARIWPD